MPSRASQANGKPIHACNAFQVLRASFAGRRLKLCPEDMRDTTKPMRLSPGGARPHPAAAALKYDGDLSNSQALVYFWQWAHALWLPK